MTYLVRKIHTKLEQYYKDKNNYNIQYSGSGAMRSTDMGQTWHQIGLNNPMNGFAGTMWTDFRSIVNDAGNSNVRWWSLTGNGVLISYDDGETWNLTVSQPVDNGVYSQVQLAPDITTGRMYALCVSSEEESSSLKYTSNYGKTWEKIGNFYLGVYANDPFPRIDVHPSGPIAILAYGSNYTYPTVWINTDPNNNNPWISVTDHITGYNVGWGITGLCWHNSTTLLISTAGHSIIAVHI